jgi:hypothetical protein
VTAREAVTVAAKLFAIVVAPWLVVLAVVGLAVGWWG